MRIGFIGLGNMGGLMALDLIRAGHTLIVHDVRREAATSTGSPTMIRRLHAAFMDKGVHMLDSTSPWMLQEEAAGVVVRATR